MRLIVGCLLAFAACGGDSGGDTPIFPDAAFTSDAAASSDAPPAPGLEVTWLTQPTVPGAFSSGVTVASLTLKVARLEVIGDAGTTVDTTKLDFEVAWSATKFAFPISFFSAPPGLYSQVSLQIDGKLMAPSYEITGMFDNAGTPASFRISDTAALAVDITGYNVTLMPGASREVPIRVNLQDALSAVNFASLPMSAGVYTMTESTTGIQAVRDALDATVFVRGN